MFRFKKRKSRNRSVTKNARFLRLKRLHRKPKRDNGVIVGIKRAVKKTPYNVSPTKPLRLRRGSVKHVVASNNNNYYQPAVRALKVTKPLTSKPPCQKRKERRSVLLAKGLGGAIHKKRKWNASSFERCA